MFDLDSLNQFSATVGRDLLLTQGAGGNLSQKTQDTKTLWVKASGMWLADALEKSIYLDLNLPKLLTLFESNQTQDLSPAFLHTTAMKPSIEALLHAVMPHKVVVHLHAIAAMYWSVLADGYAQLQAFAPTLDIGWISYAKPGYPLAKAVQTALKNSPQQHSFILANHGLLYGSGSVSEAVQQLLHLSTALMPRKRNMNSQVPSEKPIISGLTEAWSWAEDPEIHALAQDPTAFEILQRGILYPDQAVFLGIVPPIVKNEITQAILQLKWAVVPHIGVLIHQDLSKNAYALLQAHAQLLLRLDGRQELNVLSDEDIQALINWDAEKYRQQIAI